MLPELFSNHAVFEKLEQMSQALESENAKAKIPNLEYNYFQTAHDFVLAQLKTAIPILIAEPEVIALAADIEAGTAQINAFLGNDNAGHITNAFNNYGTAINRAKIFPIPIANDFNFSKIVSDFQSTVDSAYKQLKSLNGQLEVSLLFTKDDLVKKQAQIEDLEKVLAAKNIEIQTILSGYSVEFEALKTNANLVIEADRKKFTDSIEADRKLYKEQNAADRKGIADAFKVQEDSVDENSGLIIAGLNSKLAEANKIVNIVGNVGVTGNYQNIANQNKKSADFFRWVAIGFMVIMSALLAITIIELSHSDFNLYKSLVRILAAAVLTYPALYASRESTRHRNLETSNRNLELELASIGPFIELLPEDKKEKIKEELVNKYFGNSRTDSTKGVGDEGSPIDGFEKILKVILPYVKK